MRTVAVVNQKGGVGKTTTAVNLAHALALRGLRVTALDLDPQGHLGASFGLHPGTVSGMDDVLFDGVPLRDRVQRVRDGLSIVPAGPRLADIDALPGRGAERGLRLRRALAGGVGDCDYLLIDCPPGSPLILINILLAAGEVLVPVVGDYLSLQGLSSFAGTLRNVEERIGHVLRQWIVVTRFQSRRRLPREILERLIEYFPRRVLSTTVRESAALAECPSHAQTIFEYRRDSHGAIDYAALATDLIDGRTA